ncbi:ABC transporter substrate-binding protein [Paenibacillus crassostreae]|uniref:ABC transporter substrate-binding protein n=1 Tax=Paenibacillus crassostreae TaxID=1763538 RepID=A0A167EUD6_9BACL|nr:ABC transporter substrate-binding protein [Paenibacillus crassostreae]AOZ93457.1 ABC transporter substrate-binding protein [Paenibacillus crassostreae]OAB75888.1 ABC transporter substrate-binding protein [Paenibacillus crassostreae]
MKGRTPKTFAMLLLASALLVSACGNNGASNNTGETNEPAATNTEEKVDTSPVTFSFFGADASPNWNNMQDEVGKAITEKTGVTINAEFAVQGGGQDKIALMAASGDYPDMIFAKGDISKMVDAEAMIDLTDLIEEHAPNLKKVYGDYMDRLPYSSEDRSIYVLPSNAHVGQTYFDSSGGFEIQHEVLKELGYPEVKTLEDYENVLQTYYDKHPTIDGQPTIPLTLDADDWRIMITVTNPAFQSTGAPDDGEYYINPETFEAQLHYKRPEEKEYFRWLNHMYNIGLLDKNTFVQKSDEYKAKIASGRVLGLIDQEWGYADAENALKASGKPERSYAHFPVTLTSDIVDHGFQDTGFMAGWGIGITTSAEDPVRIIKFLDYLASDEGQILKNWGIEGKHYVIEDGKRVIPADVLDKKINDASNFTKTTGIGLYLTFSGHYGDGVLDPTGNYYTTNFPEQIVASYSEPEKESLKAYNATTWKDLWPSEDEMPVKPWGAAWDLAVEEGSEYSVTFQKTQDIIRKRIPEAILTTPEKFDAVYDGMIAELNKAGAEKMEAEYTELVKARVDLWSGK